MAKAKTSITLSGLRETLSEQLPRISSGKIEPKAANAVTATVGKILAAYKLEAQYRKNNNLDTRISGIV